MLSLREAAQLCGRGKSTIQTSIKDGRLSAGRNELGGYEIDPAELHRVFPYTLSGDGTEKESHRTEQDTDNKIKSMRPKVSENAKKPTDRTGQALSDPEVRMKHLKELLDAERAGRQELKEALQARVDDLQGTICDLRKRLDQAEEEKLRLLPPPDKKELLELVPERRGLWARLTGR
jgi:hypothetical protein